MSGRWPAALLAVAIALAGCEEGRRRLVFAPGTPASPALAAPSATQVGAPAAANAPPAPTLRVGADATAITPTAFEDFLDANANGEFDSGEQFLDQGVDRLFDPQEPGALGPDGAPGLAGRDDDGNGVVDDASEYRATGSDDLVDPAGDNFSLLGNPGGTEGNGQFEMLPLAGFQGIYGLVFRPARSIHDDLWARSLVVEELGGASFVLQSLDLVGLQHVDINPVKRRVERVLGIPFRNIVIASTHNHHGPDVVGVWRGGVDEGFVASVRERMFRSIERAWQARRPARMRSGQGEPESAYDPLTLLRKRHPQVHAGDYLEEHEDPVRGFDRFLLQTDLRDPIVRHTKVSAMRFEDAATGGTIATLVNWHNHPEVMGDKNSAITSDFPHYLRQRVEGELGGLCIYLSGTVGGQIGALHGTKTPKRDAQGRRLFQAGVFDIQGQPFPELASGGNFENIRSIGYEVADVALAILRAAPETVSPRLQMRTDDLDVEAENPLFMALAAGLRSRVLRPFVEKEDLPYAGPLPGLGGGFRVQLSVVRLGEAELLTAPGEIPPEYLLGRHGSIGRYFHKGYPDQIFPAMPALEDHMSGRDKFIAGLANSYLGYLIHQPDVLPLVQRGHPNYYEEQVTCGPHFGDAVGNKLMQMLGSPVRYSSYPIKP